MEHPGALKLAQWLRGVCQKEGLSLRQAGDRAKLSHGTIADVMAGKAANPQTIIKLAKAFSNGNHHRQALQDKLLVLVGYRIPSQDISPPLAELIDSLKEFSEAQLNLVKHFADFLVESRRLNEQVTKVADRHTSRKV